MPRLAPSTSAADLKFLQRMRLTRLGTSNRKAALALSVASALLFPKFVSEDAATTHGSDGRPARAAGEPFGLILMDVHMPGSDGIEGRAGSGPPKRSKARTAPRSLRSPPTRSKRSARPADKPGWTVPDRAVDRERLKVALALDTASLAA